MAARVPPPSPQEIATRAEEVRRKWTDREKKKRCVYETDLKCRSVSERVFVEASGPRRLQKLY